MTRRQYQKFTSAQLAGRQAVTTRELRNSLAVLAQGSVVTIHGKVRRHGTSGLSIESAACEHCHVRVIMTAVEPEDVDLFPREGDPR